MKKPKYHVYDLTKPPIGTIPWKDKDGKVVLLNEMEQRSANVCQRLVNALGYEINITTLTTILKQISEQKYFQFMPADFLPLVVGEGAWSTNVLNYREYNDGSDFEEGILGLATDNTRLATTDAAIDDVPAKVFDWGKSISWNLIQLNKAAKAGNWDLIAAKERSRVKNWQLGIQKVSMVGAKGSNLTVNGQPGQCLGLLNMAGITTDTTTLQNYISALDTTDFKTFCAQILGVYQKNNNYTAMPTHLIVPSTDYLGMAAPLNPDFPIKSILQQLLETFQTMTMNKNFKILPMPYANIDSPVNPTLPINGGALAQNLYVLLNHDVESLRMDIPVDYTSTLANSINNFSFQNAGYGEFTGVRPLRPQEVYYLRHTATEA